MEPPPPTLETGTDSDSDSSNSNSSIVVMGNDDDPLLLLQSLLLLPQPLTPPTPPYGGVDRAAQTDHCAVERVVATARPRDQARLRQCLHLFQHVATCNKGPADGCDLPACRRARGELEHAKACHTQQPLCETCHRVRRLVGWHARACRLPEGQCRVDNCWAVRVERKKREAEAAAAAATAMDT